MGGPAKTRASADHALGAGSPEPLGVAIDRDGVNVAVFSAHAEAIDLCLFDAAGERETARIRLLERTGDVFHGRVAGVVSGTRYGLRADGPYDPGAGHRFNPAKLLVDPYSLLIDRPFRLHPSMFGFVPGTGEPDDADSGPFMPKGIVGVPQAVRPWENAPPWDRTSITEIHVRGFSALHPGIPAESRGTWAGLATPAAIAHFTALGISTVEIMPAAAWIDERHLLPLGLSNYWGYNPVAMLAPDPRLAPGGWAEIREAVAALNAAGIEVLLDVVYNHTGEGDAEGPTLSFRGLDNLTYYRLDPVDHGYVNDAGCGNVLAADRPPVVRLILDALRAWARYGGVNGFRFDLTTTLGRGPGGFDPAAPVFAAIEQDPLLRALKLVAEPWDTGPGGYRLGSFSARWGEWNDKYRDGVRRFWRGDGAPAELATRLTGSSDVFWGKRRPSRSVNYASAHDGFTLADLMAYERKHNEANGEQNRDGTDSNWSWNNGTEGPSHDPGVNGARLRDQRNLLATVLLSRGTPMLGPGAELGQTQRGNNNAYAQDNAASWLDWSRPEQQLTGFIKRLVALRTAHPALHDDHFLTGTPRDGSEFPDVVWRLPDGGSPGPGDWDHPATRTLIGTFCAAGQGSPDDRVMVVVHSGSDKLDVMLPEARKGWQWLVALDTDRVEPQVQRPAFPGSAMVAVAPRSVLVFVEENMPADASMDPGSSDLLDHLAAAAGIAPEWHEIAGPRHSVSPDTKRALLAAMGLPAATAGEIRDSLATLAARQFRPLPDGAASHADAAVALRLVEDPAGPPPSGLTILREDGREEHYPIDPGRAERAAFTAADGREGIAASVILPPQPIGRHRILLDGHPDAACALTVAPPRSFLPEDIRAGQRLFGVSTHLYTLRRQGDGGIGDFTTLGDFAAGAARHGAGFVGLNPMHAQFAQYRDRASPYNPSDRRFLDPIYIDVAAAEILGEAPEVGQMLAAAGELLTALRGQPLVDYPNVWMVKKAVLEAAFAAFDARRQHQPGDPDVLAFDEFVANGGRRLQRYAAFEAITEAHPGKPWMDWDDALRRPGSPAVEAFAQASATRLRFHQYLQWIAERQFAKAAERGASAGLSLGFYRDIAVGTAPDGAEAWAEAAYFARGVSVGAPPDPFSAEGQIWSLPPPNPIAETTGETFAHLLEANMRHAGALRIDHAMGLQRLFWVPDGARGADGAYVSYPIERNLADLALESHRARCLVIGEDLGTVPEGFREKLAAADVLSYRVIFFERDGPRFLPPEAYPAKAVACVSTHDLPTLAGWWDGADIAERHKLGSMTDEVADRAAQDRQVEKAALVEALHLPRQDLGGELALVLDGVHRFVAATPSVLAVAQIDDLVGETVSVNLPGTDRERPNWRRRLEPEVATMFDRIPDGLPTRSPGPPIE